MKEDWRRHFSNIGARCGKMREKYAQRLIFWAIGRGCRAGQNQTPGVDWFCGNNGEPKAAVCATGSGGKRAGKTGLALALESCGAARFAVVVTRFNALPSM
jgi:hypothetical protein